MFRRFSLPRIIAGIAATIGAAGAVVFILLMVPKLLFSTIQRHPEECTQRSHTLCDFELPGQQAVFDELWKNEAIEFRQFGPSTWSGACVLVPWTESTSIQCTASVDCPGEIRKLIDNNQDWVLDDTLWGIAFLSGCSIQQVSRFRLGAINLHLGAADYLVRTQQQTPRLVLVKRTSNRSIDARIALGQ
jgi:hypothetical protein